ncbi:signal recognition particle receptor subunit beta [Streptacidiphilus sp. MAP12-16]|uniref:GTP-binding protein n=1 Tax=Streptacidiphilus sp. MAP12-16 TaxID=3156300 RepID=UPI0035157F57
MASKGSDPADRAELVPTAVKIIVAGGFGVGKTTLVGSVSEVPPLETEEYMTQASVGVDDLAGVENKHTTTVAMDFGRITISADLVLYLFGAPGQERFLFMWNDLVYGALGAVVLADTRRLEDCFLSVDFFERYDIPFVVGVNCFHGVRDCGIEDVRAALDLDDSVPVILCDVRELSSSKDLLLALLESVQSKARADPLPAAGAPVA